MESSYVSPDPALDSLGTSPQGTGAHFGHEALLYTTCADGKARCHLCAHRCLIPDGKRGLCQVRVNQGGKLYTLVYGHAIAAHFDPIEKKPLYHFYPGSNVYSVATQGCNFRCRWCQNWEISQDPKEQDGSRGYSLPPEQIVGFALAHGSRGIAYTYTEPTVFFEYAYDTARLAHTAGLANIFVTNGYMSDEMLSGFWPFLDAANVDIKSFRAKTYQRYVGARLQPVLDATKTMRALHIWLEVTTLIIPGINDETAELRDLARFIVEELGPETPWHISRFFPAHQMTDWSPTPLETMRQAREIGRKEGLLHIYFGNVAGTEGQDTLCPGCGRLLIHRAGLGTMVNSIEDGGCPDCGLSVAGVGMRREN